MLTIAQKEMGSNVVSMEMTGVVALGRSCQEIEWAVDKLIQAGTSKIIFDLTNVTRMDSSGIGVIVMACGKLKKAGGNLRLAGVQEKVRDVLVMTQIDKVVAMYDTAQAALAGF